MTVTVDYEIESVCPVALGSVEVRRYAWAQPLDQIYSDPHPVLGLSLSAVPSNSKGRFQSGSRRDNFAPIGRLIFRPGNLPLHCINAGGAQRLILCNFQSTQSAIALANEAIGKLGLTTPHLDLRNDTIIAALKRVAVELACPGFASHALVEALATTIDIELMRACSGSVARNESSRGGLAGWQLRRIREALQELNGTSLTVSMLAELVGISPRHLVRAFRQSTGSTVVGYIAQVKLTRALELLASSEFSLKQIAYQSGFATPSSFAAAFKRATGESPSDYRLRAWAGGRSDAKQLSKF